MRTRELKALKLGARVSVTGEMDATTFTNEMGVVVSVPWINDNERCIKFDTWRGGWGSDGSRSVMDHWTFSEAQCRQFNITVIPSLKPEPAPVAPKKRPHGKQEYKGNGKHEWEAVTGSTVRLRVPGGWLYGKTQYNKVLAQTTFVPVPTAVGYAV